MFKRDIKCAECQRPAAEHGVGDDESWDEPFCDRCGKPLTIEGLLIEEIKSGGKKDRVRELGRSGVAVLEYKKADTSRHPDVVEAEKFLRRIYELKQRSKADGTVVNRQQYLDALANFPLASARFRRWFREDYHGRPLEITEKYLVSLAVDLLAQQTEDETETIYRQYETRQEIALDWLSNYEIRMHFETPLVVKGRLPTFVRDLISESQDAFRFGLPLVTIAGCRMIIDGLIAELAKVQFAKLSQTTRRRIQGSQKGPHPTASVMAAEKTPLLIDELPERYLNPSEKNDLKELRKRCSDVIHGRRREGPQTIGPLDERAWRMLQRATQFVSKLIERGGLTA